MELWQKIEKRKHGHPTYTEMQLWMLEAKDLLETLEKCKDYLKELGYDYDKKQTRMFNKALDELEDR